MAGESAQEQYERVRSARLARQRELRPLLIAVTVGVAGLFALLFDFMLGMWWLGGVLGAALVLPRALAPPQREVAWRRGAQGERVVGAALDALAGEDLVVLHDRRLPRSKANVDHLVVTRSGVFVIDAKHYQGRLAVRGGRLLVAGRDRSRLLEQMDRQQLAVAGVLSDAGLGPVPVTLVLCFVGVEWPLLFRPREVAGVRLCGPRGLAALIDGDGALAGAGVHEIAGALAEGLQTAAAGPPPVAADTRPAGGQGQPRGGATSPGADGAEAPVCSCGAPMRRRERRRDGVAFWGCSTFPACRSTRPIEGT